MMSDNDSSASGYVTDAFEGINREFTDVASAIGIEKVEDLGNCIVMEYIEGITLKKWLQAELLHRSFKDIWDKTTEDLNGVINGNTLALIEQIQNIDTAMQEADPTIFETSFHKLMNQYDWTETETEYHKEKKMHTVTMKWLQEKQERELQKVLEMDIMHHADEPSTQDIEDSDYQYHRRFLSHKFKDTPEYQEAYTKFMKFATRQDGMIVPNLGEYGKYLAININKFRPEQKKALFEIIRIFELIREDAEQIPQERDEVISL